MPTTELRICRLKQVFKTGAKMTIESVFNPYVLLAKVAIVITIVVGIFGAGYFQGAKNGEIALAQKVVEDQQVIDKLKSDYNSAVANANGIAAGNTAVLQSNVNGIAKSLAQENQNAHKNLSSNKPLVFHSQLSANVNIGLHASPANPALGKSGQHPTDGVQGNSDTTIAAGTGDQAQCRPDDATQQSLRAIAQDGDDAIRQLNALIDAYNLVRSVGCSITPAPASELKTLLSDTEVDPTTVTTEETSHTLSVSKLKEGLLSIGPLLSPSRKAPIETQQKPVTP